MQGTCDGKGECSIGEIQEEPAASSMGGSRQGGTSHSGDFHQADVECPLCFGSGAVSLSVVEDEWQPEDTLVPAVGWEVPYNGSSARRRRNRHQASGIWWRPCRALIVSTMYISVALTLGFLGFSFYPRNPDFDLIDVHFTKLQLRWERDPSVLRSQAASEVGSDTGNEKVLTVSNGSTALQGHPTHRRAALSKVERWLTALEQVVDAGRNETRLAQELASKTELVENRTAFWEELPERMEEGGATIFGRRLVLDIDLMVKVLVKNPNKVGVHYEASSLDIIYKDKKLGQAALPSGQQAAASSTILVVPAQLNGLSTIGMSLNLLRDWEKKSVEMDIAARFTGTVDMIKIIPHEFIADMYCDVLTNPRNLIIMKRTCEWKYSGRI